MSCKIIAIRNHDEMLARLLKVSDDSRLQERFYPILLEQAGQERIAQDFIMWLAIAIREYVESMPPGMAPLMYMQAPGFIDALVSDPEIVAEAMSFLRQEALSAFK